MSEPDQKLSSRPDESGRGGVGEHILNILKAGLATAPFCGGIASLLNDYIPNAKMKRLEEFTQRLAADLLDVQDQVRESDLLTDEFAFLLEKCFRGVAENYQAEKLEAFRCILVNAAVGSSLAEEEKEYYLNLVGTFSALHIRILTFLANPRAYLTAHGIPEYAVRGGLPSIFRTAIPGVEIEVVKSAFGDLYQYGLINTDKSMFNTMTAGEGLHLLGDRVTPHGRGFVAFCTR